jgi:23S rRNA pseudouridine1911/1915/1917 synthase
MLTHDSRVPASPIPPVNNPPMTRDAHRRPAPPAPAADLPDDTVAAGSLILRGGKVDPDAILAAMADDADDEGLRTVTFTLQRPLDKRLDKYLTDRITFMSRNQLQRLIDAGDVTVNGKPAKASHKVTTGDTVAVVIPPPPPRGAVPEEIPLDILHEDPFLIVLNKQPDIIVHPARSHLSGTLINALAWHFKHRSTTGGALSGVGEEFARPGVVHRLDRDTTGCIVFAKQDEAHWKLGHQFEHRRVDKRYLALVHGWVEPLIQTIEFPLGPHPSRERGLREKQVVRHDELGKPALTICRVRERYSFAPRGPLAPPRPETAEGWTPTAAPAYPAALPGSSLASDCYSLVELELKTGRTHQIRVHLSHLGWPIVGDDMYGGKPFITRDKNSLLDRQALHAAVLGFTHPVTEAKMRFTAPLRGDLGAAVAHLRTRSTSEGTHETHTPAGATVEIVV